ncbi:MAG: DNA recombination protein RmuC, partial [Alphaproteobacteria bacterium]
GRREAERAERLEDAVGRVAAAQSELAGRLSALAEANATNQSNLVKSLEARFDSVRQHLGSSLNEQAQKTSETLTQLQSRLAVIDAAQKNITELSGQVVSLQEILSNKQARGAFGEIQMTDLVSQTLPPSAYSFQTSLSNGKRADCLIRLPNPPGAIAVDAKFPLESFHALRNAETDEQRITAERAFRAALLKHVSDIAERYIVPGETAESALMFLPSEAIYAELHARFTDVVEKSFRQRVWIVSPTTFMATLNTVRAVLKDAHMREQAGVIQQEILKMIEDVVRLEKRASNLQRHLGQTEEDVRQILVSTDKITRRAEKIEEVQLGEPDAPSVEVPRPAPALARADEEG